MPRTPVAPGSSGAAVLPYLQYGFWDPTVVATPGEPGGLYIQIPREGTSPPGAFGLFQKSMNSNDDTDWVKFIPGSSTPTELDYKDPVDTIDGNANINLAAPGNIINGVDMSLIVGPSSFLAHSQTISSENGIYNWNGPAIPATRRADAVNPFVQKGMFTWVNSGPTILGLTGWILITPNPINVGVTALTFAQIPISAAQTTRISGLYWVAANGSDVNPATRGAIAAPFATIQAAINQAVAEGHGVNNPANVYVMAKAGIYAGFNTAIGINVTGMAGLHFKNVNVGPSSIVPDASGINNNTGNALSNLQFTNIGVGFALNWSSPNLGRWKLINCRITNNDPATAALLFSSVGSLLILESCNVLNADTGPAMLAAAGITELNTFCQLESQGTVLVISLPALVLSNGNLYNAIAGGVCVDCNGLFYSKDDQLNNAFGASVGDGFYVRNGGSAVVINCDIITPNNCYTVFLGGTLKKSCISFSGVSQAFLDNGTTITIPLTGLGYNPAVPADWTVPPTDVKQALDELVNGLTVYKVVGTVGVPVDVTGLPTIPFASSKMFTKIYISAAAPQVMAGPPEIGPGVQDGQELLITNAGAQNITIPGVSGTSQNGAIVLIPGDQIKYSWDTLVWNEIARKQ